MLGIDVDAAANRLTVAPQVPVDWNRVAVNNVRVGDTAYHLAFDRSAGRQSFRIRATRKPDASNGERRHATEVRLAPSFPLDAKVRSVTLNGRQVQFSATRTGDIQRAEVQFDPGSDATVVYDYDEGTDVYIEARAPDPGTINKGLRILRSAADANALKLSLEGLGGREYRLGVRTPRRLGIPAGVRVIQTEGRDPMIFVTFDGPPDTYVRREVIVSLMPKK